jgi:hypothetical protein
MPGALSVVAGLSAAKELGGGRERLPRGRHSLKDNFRGRTAWRKGAWRARAWSDSPTLLRYTAWPRQMVNKEAARVIRGLLRGGRCSKGGPNGLRTPHQGYRQIDAHRLCAMILSPGNPSQMPSIGNCRGIDGRITRSAGHFHSAHRSIWPDLHGEHNGGNLARFKTGSPRKRTRSDSLKSRKLWRGGGSCYTGDIAPLFGLEANQPDRITAHGKNFEVDLCDRQAIARWRLIDDEGSAYHIGLQRRERCDCARSPAADPSDGDDVYR